MEFNGNRLLVATDEAGYGPQLGPLVIAATCWELADDGDATERFSAFEQGVEIEQLGRIQMADSKRLFSPRGQGGLQTLEAAMLAISAACAPAPITELGAWLQYIAPDCLESLTRCPWFANLDESFPIDAADVVDWDTLRATVHAAFKSNGVELRSASAAVISAEEFNRLCDLAGNKATLLSEQTVELAMGAIAGSDAKKIEVFSDKHGGRAYYGGLLQHYFPDGRLTIEVEGRLTSRYCIELENCQIVWHFTAKGDSFPPVALASMVAKYTRERLMGCFNRYWETKVPGIHPTAGYPGDAGRFLKEIDAAINNTDIGRESLIRSR